MKHFYPTLPAILIVVLGTTVRGQEILPAPVAPRSTCGIHPAELVPPPAASAKTHGTVRAAKEKLVRELVGILKKTKSTDTFLVTVKALADMGPPSRAAVPEIIVNAERLGLLKDILKQVDDEQEDDNPGDFIVEAIEHIVAPRHERQMPHPVAPMGYPPPGVIPPPPSVVSPLMCPIAPALTPDWGPPHKTAQK
jgi:hypothetical protein